MSETIHLKWLPWKVIDTKANTVVAAFAEELQHRHRDWAELNGYVVVHMEPPLLSRDLTPDEVEQMFND